MNSTTTQPKGISELKRLPASVLKRAVALYRAANPAFWTPCGTKDSALITLTDHWGAVQNRYAPFLAQAIQEASK